LTGLYRDELLPAAAAGVSFMTDRETDRNNGYNVGELEIAVALQVRVDWRHEFSAGYFRTGRVAVAD
jgi:hypothetical protein